MATGYLAETEEVIDYVARWEDDFDLFLQDMGDRPVFDGRCVTPQQQDVWQSVRDNKRTAVKSGNGTGKDWLAARIACHYLVTRGIKPPHEAIVITTSPKEQHLKKVLWGEIRRTMRALHPVIGGHLMPAEPHWYADQDFFPKWYMAGMVARGEGSFSGFRAAHVMIIVDEACDVEQHIWDAIGPMVSGPDHKLLAIGNPVNSAAPFYDCFRSPTFNCVTLSSRDTAEYELDVAGMANWDMIHDLEAEHGPESGFVRIHVDGEFAATTEDKTFPLDWIQEAEKRYVNREDHPHLVSDLTMGVDPSGGVGRDEAVIVVRDSFGIREIFRSKTTEPMALCAKVQEIAAKHEMIDPVTRQVLRKSRIVIDSIGNDVAGRLRELGVTVDAFRGGDKPRDKKKFTNRRAEGYWSMREAMDPRVKDRLRFSICMPQVHATRALRAELDAQRHKYQSDRLIAMEPKEKIKKRLDGKSPDIADALSMTFAPSKVVRVW